MTRRSRWQLNCWCWNVSWAQPRARHPEALSIPVIVGGQRHRRSDLVMRAFGASPAAIFPKFAKFPCEGGRHAPPYICIWLRSAFIRAKNTLSPIFTVTVAGWRRDASYPGLPISTDVGLISAAPSGQDHPAQLKEFCCAVFETAAAA